LAGGDAERLTPNLYPQSACAVLTRSCNFRR
jgi:hypothetical protein